MDVNIDARLAAARAEGRRQSHTITFRGTKYEAASSVPWSVMEMARGETFDIDGYMEAVFGAEQWKQIATVADMDEVLTIMEATSELYGMSPGKSASSGRSSSSTGTPSKRTSSGSTGSTSRKRSSPAKKPAAKKPAKRPSRRVGS